MAKILIIEDEPIIADDLYYQLQDLGHEVLSIEYNYKDGLAAIHRNQYDLLLLDINLNDQGDGIDLASIARRQSSKPLIFMTSHSDHNTVQRAKLVEPEAYIVKPIDEKDLRINITLALFRHASTTRPKANQEESEVFLIRDNKGLTKIDVADIVYVESMNNYAMVHTADRRFVVSKPLKHVQEQLPQTGFFRIHKKYVINMHHLKSVEYGAVLLTSTSLPIGRSYKREFLESMKTLS